MSKKKIIIIILALCLGIAVFYAYREYNRKPLTAAQKESDFRVTAVDLVQEFTENEAGSMKKYNDKVVEVSGVVASVNANGKVFDILLESDNPMVGVNVNLIPEMNTPAQALKPGDKIILKGICTGIVTDIELNKGVIK